jgi:hypothetical protein
MEQKKVEPEQKCNVWCGGYGCLPKNGKEFKDDKHNCSGPIEPEKTDVPKEPADNETVEDGGGCFAAGSKPECPELPHYYCQDSVCGEDHSTCQKRKVFIDGDFNDSYESKVKNSKGENTIISKQELADLRAIKSPLSNLLAVMHGDGGHHEQKVGTVQAVNDALELLHTKWVWIQAAEDINKLMAERDKLKEDLREHGTTRNRLLSANSDIQHLKAENERLKDLAGNALANHEQYGYLVDETIEGLKSYLENK